MHESHLHHHYLAGTGTATAEPIENKRASSLDGHLKQ